MPIKVLIAPLDWGMGHTTRMIGLADLFRAKGAEVLFALPKNQQFLLKGTHFQTIPIAGYKIKYYVGLPPTLSLLLQIPKIFWTFMQEPFLAKKLAQKHNIQLIISDNRPFFRHRDTYSVYVTHQLNLPIQHFWKPLVQNFYQRIINKFNCCLVPDFPDNRLSGELSKNNPLKIPTLFCGPLSRFLSKSGRTVPEKIKYDVVFISSGPQPYKDYMIKRVKKLLSGSPGRFAIVGNSQNKRENSATNIDVFESPNTDRFREILETSKAVFSLAGYTTIMDTAVISKPLFMWPTPGQWEQEYLAKHLKETTGFYVLEKTENVLLQYQDNLVSPELFSNIFAVNAVENLLQKVNKYKTNG